MLLLPIGRDETEIRRHAWVSYVIIAVNVLVFFATSYAQRPSAFVHVRQKFEETLSYAEAHPYLRLPADFAKFLPPKAAGGKPARIAPPGADIEAEQSELNDLAMSALETLDHYSLRRFTYVPAERGFWRQISSMFMHGGFLHLFGNLLFFFLSGPFIEDVFGRPLFAFLYFSGGIAATMTYALRHPDSTIPLVGASGAIAAVMGAYLVRFAKSRIEFLFVPIIWRPHWNYRFWAPAFVVLPLWFAEQVWDMYASEAGAGVAFSAHAGGFLYGLAIAAVVHVSGFEKKVVDPHVTKLTTWQLDPHITRAMAARHAGNLAGARRELSILLGKDATNLDALRLSVDVAIEEENAATVDAHATRLLSLYGKDQGDLATQLIHEITAEALPLPKFFVRAAAFAERENDRDWAMTLYERALESDPNGSAAVGSLMKLGTLLRASGDTRAARAALERARAHPACSAEIVPVVDARLAQL